MPTAILEIQDEVNVRFIGVPKNLIAEAQSYLTYYVPNFKFMTKYKLGQWDGKIRLLSNTGKTYLNLIHDITPFLERNGYDFEIDDQRADWSSVIDQLTFPSEDDFSEYTLDGESPIKIRDYQLSATHAAIREGQGLLEMATGSGKTLTTGVLASVYAPYGKVVVIVPNIDLVLQTQATYRKMGLDVGIWYGECKDSNQITIATWQSLDNFPELFIGVICCIVDEAHEATAKTLTDIMSGPASNVPFRFGCTGTVPKDELSRQQLRGIIGETIFQLSSWELQQRGVLADSHVMQIELNDQSNPRYQTAPDFESWTEEVDFLLGDVERLDTIRSIIMDAAETEGNVLLLVPFKKHGKIIQELIPGSVSIDGDDKSKDRREVYTDFNDGDNQVLICTFGIAATGIDIPRIMVLGFLEPGKKFQKVIQVVGRGLRKAHDKDYVTILDFFSNTGRSKKHASERRKIYKGSRISHEIVKVDYVNFE